MKTIAFAESADKVLKTIPDVQARAIEDALIRYATTGQGDVKALKGDPALRLRVGDYRIVFDETPDTIEVLVLAHRRSVYR